MSDYIFETVVTTCAPDGAVHVAPMGVRYVEGKVVLKPFRPSQTLDNILATRRAVLNVLTDVRVFAGCVTGRKVWPTVPVNAPDGSPAVRLARMHEAQHSVYPGFNRAQAAVIEGAVLVSRLHLLPRDKIEGELAYLQIAIDKTAGGPELEAWAWLQEAVARHCARAPAAA